MPHGSPAGTAQPTQPSSPSHHPARPPGAVQGRTQGSGQAGTRVGCTPDTEQELGAPSPRICSQRSSSKLSISVWLQIAARRAPSSLPNMFSLPSVKSSFPGK